MTGQRSGKKKAIIFRGSKAIGDMLFVSALPRLLKEHKGFDIVDVASWKENACVFLNNKFVNKIIALEEYSDKLLTEVINDWSKEYEVFDLRYTVEGQLLRWSHDRPLDLDTRRKNAENKNYYRDIFSRWDIIGSGKPEIYLTNAEWAIIKDIKSKTRARILWHLGGSARNKFLPYMPAYINGVAEKRPDIEHWLGGLENVGITGIRDNVKFVDARGIWNVREVLTMPTAFDLVVGPESSFINAAGAYDEVKKLCFFSHSAPDNLTKYFENAYAIRPFCSCHPCYLLLKNFREEWTTIEKRCLLRNQELYCSVWESKDRYTCTGFRCTLQIDHQKVVDKILELIE